MRKIFCTETNMFQCNMFSFLNTVDIIILTTVLYRYNITWPTYEVLWKFY